MMCYVVTYYWSNEYNLTDCRNVLLQRLTDRTITKTKTNKMCLMKKQEPIR